MGSLGRWTAPPPCPFIKNESQRINVDLQKAIGILAEWAREAAKGGVIYPDYWVAEYPTHWDFSPCGANGEIWDVSCSVAVSKETGETSKYFPPDHPEDRGKGSNLSKTPLHIDIWANWLTAGEIWPNNPKKAELTKKIFKIMHQAHSMPKYKYRGVLQSLWDEAEAFVMALPEGEMREFCWRSGLVKLAEYVNHERHELNEIDLFIKKQEQIRHGVFWLKNKDWYRIDSVKNCYELTDKAPEDARISFGHYKKEYNIDQ